MLMKKYFTNLAIALSVFAGLAMIACSDDDAEPTPVTPEFPALVESAITADTPFSMTVQPNMEWTVSIPTTGDSAQWFYIQDGSQKVFTVHGSADEQKTITVCVNEGDEFDTDRVCSVSMTMNGVTREIATLTRYRLNRLIEFYTAKIADDGDGFMVDDNYAYVYNETPVTSFSLESFYGAYDQQRVKVVANMPWAFSRYPAWTNINVTTGEIGTTEVFIYGDQTAYPFEDSAENIDVVDITDINNPVEACSISVEIGGCSDYFSSSMNAAEMFNAAGGYYNPASESYYSPDYGVYKQFSVVYGSEVFFVVGDASGNLSVGDSSSWIRFAGDFEWEDEAKSAGIWSHNMQIFCSANDGDVRTAYLVAVPRGKVPDGFNRADVIEGGKIAAEYAGCIVSEISQLGASGAFVELYENMGSEADNYFTFTELEGGDWPFKGSWANISAGYRLSYKSEVAYEWAELKFNTPFASYEIYDEAGPWAESQISPRWVDLADSWNEDGKCIKIAGEYDGSKYIWTYEAPVNPMAYFVFKDDAGKIIGLIEFVYEGDIEQGGEEGLALYGENPSVELQQLSESDPGFDPDTMCPQYKLTFTDYYTTTANITIDYEYDSVQYSEGGVSIMRAGSYYMLQFEFENDGDTGMIILAKNYMPVCCIYTEYRSEGGGEDEITGVSIKGDSPTVFLTGLVEGDADFDADMTCPQYKLTFTDYDVCSVDVLLPNYTSYYFSGAESSLFRMGSYYSINFYFEEPGDKSEILLKNEYTENICRIVLEYLPE